MRNLYAPFIGQVVEACHARLYGVRETDAVGAVDAAFAALARTVALFDDLRPAVLRSGEAVARSLQDVDVCFRGVRQALQTVQEEARATPPPLGAPPPPATAGQTGAAQSREPRLERAVVKLEDMLAELWRALDVLGSVQAAEPTWSPFPTVNLCIKVGVNVLDGHVPGEVLDLWLPRLDEVVTRLSVRLARFAALHADAPSDLTAAASSLLADVQAGDGALHGFRQHGDRATLLDGLRLLRHGTERLAVVLEEMDRHVRQSARWSTSPFVEDFCRAALEDGAWFDDAAASLEHHLQFLEAQAQAMQALPLAFSVQAELDAAADAAGAARQAFALALAVPDESALVTLQSALAAARASRDAALTALNRAMDAVSRSPHLEELKELAGRFLQGAISEAYFRTRVIDWLKAHAVLEMQLRDKARDALGSDAAELLDLLHQQGEGIEETTRFFRDGDAQHLIEGFRRMEGPLPALSAIRERVLRSLRPERGGPTQSVCFACGTASPAGRTHCRACGVLLPAISKAVERSFTADTSRPAMSSNIDRLQRVVDLYEQHQINASTVQYEVGLFLGRLGHIRRDFERRFVPRLRAERSVTLINMARDFFENLTSLQRGLTSMLEWGDHLRPDVLYRGLQECIEAGLAMREAQERVEDALAAG